VKIEMQKGATLAITPESWLENYALRILFDDQEGEPEKWSEHLILKPYDEPESKN